MKLYEVAVVAPLPKTLTYCEPVDGGVLLQPGQRILVPLGGRLAAGYILGQVEEKPAKFKVKPIREVLDPDPLFQPDIIPFFRWIADYYLYPIGEVIRTALPGGLTAGSGRRVRLIEDCRQHILEYCRDLTDRDSSWIRHLLDKGELAPAAIARLFKEHSCRNLLLDWEKKGWVTIEDEIRRSQFAVKKQVQVTLSSGLQKMFDQAGQAGQEVFLQACGEHYPDLKKSELKTLALIREQYQHKKGKPLNRPDLTRLYAGAGGALKSLAAEGVLLLEEKRVYRDLFGREHGFQPRPDTLTSEQLAVLEKIIPAIESRTFHTFLLHGVTGCGKTEVYLQATARALAEERTVLVLVPEIALASQLETHFYSRFGEQLALLHSGLSTGERQDQWQRIQSGKARIVIGARSAVFAPLPDPGLIIVDEEHEPAYKQEDGLHYSGRDLAILRGRFAGCPVLLGSATPSVVSYHHARSGKYELLQMHRRVEDQLLPEVSIVNLAEDRRSRPDLFFSDQLISALWENMDNRQQSLLFVNRRGFAGFMLCSDCGHIIQCRHCQVSLTMHRREQRLICHYCGYSISTKIICPDCGSKEMKPIGIGSERVEEEVRQILPHARVARLDSDTALNRKQYLQTLKSVYQHDVDVLIGTQMIAKGLHFPGLTLVGVIWADSGLGIPDFRASERTFQLLAQVNGRAGRGRHPGRVIIQTYNPGHYSVQHARQHDYQSFYNQEIALRRELNYPPFSRLVNIKLSGKEERKVEQCAKAVGAFLRNSVKGIEGEVEILGPAPAPLVRIKDRIRWQVMLKSSRVSRLHILCHQLQDNFRELNSGNIRMTIDVDPENMM
ncbi:MAG: primosomal protein N' [Desulfobulbaceae bacterium]|nr:primosomal protein N' [Desulfobulbaceae bacterium]